MGWGAIEITRKNNIEFDLNDEIWITNNGVTTFSITSLSRTTLNITTFRVSGKFEHSA